VRSTDDLSAPNAQFVFDLLVHFGEREMHGLADKVVEYVSVAP
jgi:hypothetical protein